MTCGIYRLVFTGTDKCYIGQSVNIEKRFRAHLISLKNSSSPTKLQQAFNKFGLPSLELILECKSSELDKAEIEAIQIFDSFINGFNSTTSQMPDNTGENNGRHKWTNQEILYAAKLLLDPTIPLSTISNSTGISLCTIQRISAGQYMWIQDIDAELYTKLIEAKKVRKRGKPGKTVEEKGIKIPPVISPVGEVFYNISNIRQFCLEHELDAGNFRKMLTGTYGFKSCKGWRLANG